MKCILEALENEGDGSSPDFCLDQQNEWWCHSLEKVRLWEKIGSDLNFGCEVIEDDCRLLTILA